MFVLVRVFVFVSNFSGGGFMVTMTMSSAMMIFIPFSPERNKFLYEGESTFLGCLSFGLFDINEYFTSWLKCKCNFFKMASNHKMI